MIKKEFRAIVTRYNRIMETICCDHLMVTAESEACYNRKAYGTEDGITVGWMLKEARYWLSCYYEEGHSRYEERKDGPEAYKAWVRETGLLKRLVNALGKLDPGAIVEGLR